MFKYKSGDLLKIKINKSVFTQPCSNVKAYHDHNDCFIRFENMDLNGLKCTVLESTIVDHHSDFGGMIWLNSKWKYKNWYKILCNNLIFYVFEDFLEPII